MKHVFLAVEGQSEERFYKSVLADYLKTTHFLEVTVMPNKKNQTSRKYKGGKIQYDTCVKNINRFIRSASHCEKIVLIFDFYGLHESFLDGYKGVENTHEKLIYIKQRLCSDINHQKFYPYFQMHEFEAFLFADPREIATHYGKSNLKVELNNILKEFHYNPEEINNSKDTSPSHRIIGFFPEYEFGKTTDGVVIAKNIGINKIREMCPSFREFLQAIM